MYRPLPDFLTIKQSKIEGLGLFATKDIPKYAKLGLSHVWSDDDAEWIRTPLGGFYNHSDNPTGYKVEEGNEMYLFALVDIKAGEEITVTYTFYSGECFD